MSIWKHSQINNLVEPSAQLSLGEADTPMDTIQINSQNVLIKREDLNPNNSFKDRSIAFWISKLISQGKSQFVISSSGNAAVSASAYASLTDINLDIFVSPKTPLHKKSRIIVSTKIKLHESLKAKSDAIKFAQQNNLTNLRGSDDPDAIIGFKTISYELYKQNPQIDAIYIPTSSATGAVGIYQGYKDLGLKPPAIHIVQNSRIHPIAKLFDTDFKETKTSIADCVTDKIAKRKNQILNIIKETKGNGWIVSDEIINRSLSLTKSKINNTSPNSHMSLAGFIKSYEAGFKYSNPCLIFSGL